MDKPHATNKRPSVAVLPTDLVLLNAIYDRYYDTFASFSRDAPTRSTKIYVPIDITSIAKKFDVDADIIFGRLYYHLNKMYQYKQDDGAYVHFLL